MGAIEPGCRAAKYLVGNSFRSDRQTGRKRRDVGNRAGAGQCSKWTEVDMRMPARMRRALLIAGLGRQARMANLQRKRAVARRHEAGRDHRLKQQRQEHGAGNQAAMSADEAKSFHWTRRYAPFSRRVNA